MKNMRRQVVVVDVEAEDAVVGLEEADVESPRRIRTKTKTITINMKLTSTTRTEYSSYLMQPIT